MDAAQKNIWEQVGRAQCRKEAITKALEELAKEEGMPKEKAQRASACLKQNNVAEDPFVMLFSEDGDVEDYPVLAELYGEELRSMQGATQNGLCELGCKYPWVEIELAVLWVRAVERVVETKKSLEQIRGAPGYEEYVDTNEVMAVSEAEGKEKDHMKKMREAEKKKEIRDRLAALKRILVCSFE
jgi:hypothetical protein